VTIAAVLASSAFAAGTMGGSPLRRGRWAARTPLPGIIVWLAAAWSVIVATVLAGLSLAVALTAHRLLRPAAPAGPLRRLLGSAALTLVIGPILRPCSPPSSPSHSARSRSTRSQMDGAPAFPRRAVRARARPLAWYHWAIRTIASAMPMTVPP
jgi:hypothetical protein